jgi:hypothetical protein
MRNCDFTLKPQSALRDLLFSRAFPRHARI